MKYRKVLPGHGACCWHRKLPPRPEARGIEPIRRLRAIVQPFRIFNAKRIAEICREIAVLSGGKPVGIKIMYWPSMGICRLPKPWLKQSMVVDFVTVDGAEGGNIARIYKHLGCPYTGCASVDNTLKGASLRDRVKIAAWVKLSLAMMWCVISHLVQTGAIWHVHLCLRLPIFQCDFQSGECP